MWGGVGPREPLITRPHHSYHKPAPSTPFYHLLILSHHQLFLSSLTLLSHHQSISCSVFPFLYSLLQIPQLPYLLGYLLPFSSHAHTISKHFVHTYSINPFPSHISPLFLHSLFCALLIPHTYSSNLSSQIHPNHSSLSHSGSMFHYHT